MTRLFIPGGPSDGFELRGHVDAEKLWNNLADGEDRIEVLVNDRNYTSQSIVIWPARLAWFSVQ